MKKLFFLFPTLYLFSCGDEQVSNESTYTPAPPDYGSEQYDQTQTYLTHSETHVSLMINEANAYQVTTFENTPESVVSYFYAALIRNDLKWQNVCPPYEKQTSDFKQAVERYGTCRSITYIPQGVQGTDVLFNLDVVDMNNQAKRIQGAASVEEIDGKYLITAIPSI